MSEPPKKKRKIAQTGEIVVRYYDVHQRQLEQVQQRLWRAWRMEESMRRFMDHNAAFLQNHFSCAGGRCNKKTFDTVKFNTDWAKEERQKCLYVLALHKLQVRQKPEIRADIAFFFWQLKPRPLPTPIMEQVLLYFCVVCAPMPTKKPEICRSHMGNLERGLAFYHKRAPDVYQEIVSRLNH
jgi:hypothetical protein